MKRSELKELVKEVLMEVSSRSSRHTDDLTPEQEELMVKFFDAAFKFIQKKGEKKTRYNGIVGGWEGDSWSYKNAQASDLNRHYSREISGPNVIVTVDRKGNFIWSKGDLSDLKELLISIL